MSTIREILSAAASKLSAVKENATDSVTLDAELLLAHSLRKDRSFLYAWPDKLLSNDEQAAFNVLLNKRCAGHPVAYLLGEREFWSLTLQVTSDVLIPHPETELLVEKVLQLKLPAAAKVLDMGTGSGAIALALASERPEWQLFASDFSAKALEVAKANARNLLLNNIAFLQSNWFESLAVAQTGTEQPNKFDLIVSNPPYIVSTDQHLQQGDLRYEPITALESGLDGLRDLREIIDSAPYYLTPKGCVVLEHGFDQAADVLRLLGQAGFKGCEVVKDYNGLDRISIGWMDGGS